MQENGRVHRHPNKRTGGWTAVLPVLSHCSCGYRRTAYMSTLPLTWSKDRIATLTEKLQ